MDMPSKQEFINCSFANNFDMNKVRDHFQMNWKLYKEFKDYHDLPRVVTALSLLTDEQFVELYMDTEDDYEMADILGVAPGTVSVARRKRGLKIVRINGRSYNDKRKSQAAT